MLALLKLVPFRDWLWAGLVIALICFGTYERQHLINEGKAHELAALKKSSDKLQAEAAAHVVQVAKAYSTASTANLETLNAQLKVASDTHDSDAQRLREFDAYRRAHPVVASAPAASGAVPAGSSSASSDEYELASLEQVALGLTAAGREVIAALTACVTDRNALTGKP